MTTLKEHKDAMVKLLATGSGIPASASRLAHAMHDVLEILLADKSSLQNQLLIAQISEQAQNKTYRALSAAVTASFMDATTPGLNEKALSKPVAATKTDSHATRPAPAEIRVKELQNTIRQLKENNVKLKADYREIQEQRDQLQTQVFNALKRGVLPSQGSPKINDACWVLHDALTEHGPLSGHQFNNLKGSFYKAFLVACGEPAEPEQAGVRKEDTETPLDEAHGSQCDHTSWEDKGCGVKSCCDCGALF